MEFIRRLRVITCADPRFWRFGRVGPLPSSGPSQGGVLSGALCLGPVEVQLVARGARFSRSKEG